MWTVTSSFRMRQPALLVVIVTNCLLSIVMFVIIFSHVVLFLPGIVYRKMSLISRHWLNLREICYWLICQSLWSTI